MKRTGSILLSILTLMLCMRPSPAGARTPADEFDVKGLHIDMRTQVMTLPALKELAREASAEGINTIIVEWEASFPFRRHAVLRNRYAYTPDEVKEFIDCCAGLGIDVIPLQNCFGHCEYILRHSRYAALREDKKEVSQVCPLKTAEAEAVFQEIFEDIAELHPSRYLHIGADETRLLGHCRQCAEKVKNEGVSNLFVDYVNTMCRIVTGLGKIPIIWCDMLLQYPEAIERLPKELIVIDWNYGWDPAHFGDIDRIRKAGITVWGASSLRSAPDNIFLTQWDKHFNNLATYIPYARENGFRGMINTSWSTSGQYGFIYDNSWEIIDMQPIRQVYPLAGFDILQRAYARAVNSPSPFCPEAFIREYAREHYGFDDNAQNLLLDYFQTPQETLPKGNGDPNQLRTQLERCENIRNRMRQLKPLRHPTDFEHLRLMLDIRIHYLRFKLAEADYESPAFTRTQHRELTLRMKSLRSDGRKLQKRFVRLNRNFLKNPLEAFNERSYLGKIETIYDILTTNSAK